MSAGPLGTVAGVQFAAVFQSLLIGWRFQVALSAQTAFSALSASVRIMAQHRMEDFMAAIMPTALFKRQADSRMRRVSLRPIITLCHCSEESKRGRIDNLMIQFPEDRTWKRLLREIRDGQCTPFLGAGASFPTLALASTIAAAWAKESRQPVGISIARPHHCGIDCADRR